MLDLNINDWAILILIAYAAIGVVVGGLVGWLVFTIIEAARRG